jgi:hypothetical protein
MYKLKSFNLFIITLVISAVCFALLVVVSCNTNAQANNVDPKTWAEGNCPYEGAECPNAQFYMKDYQIRLHMDTVWVYEADRLVGSYINTKWDSQLDSILLKDNG